MSEFTAKWKGEDDGRPFGRNTRSVRYNQAGEPIAINYSSLVGELAQVTINCRPVLRDLQLRLDVLHEKVSQDGTEAGDGFGEIGDGLLILDQDRSVGLEIRGNGSPLKSQPANVHEVFGRALLQLKVQVPKYLERLLGVFKRHTSSP
jgi:hypothetical protein